MKLREVCEITSGQNAPQASGDYQIGGKTFIKVSDLDNVIFDDNESRSCKVTDSAIKEYKLKLFPAGSIIFAKSGLSCVKNRVYLLKRPSYIVNHLCILYNFKIQINHLWLLYYLKAFNVTKLIKDFSYPSIKLSEIGEIDIPAIPLEKQNKIVEEITQLSNLCKNKLSELNSFDELIKSRFNEMFVDKGFGVKPIRYFINKDKISAKKIYSESDYINYVDISSIDNSKNEIVSSTKYVFKDAPSRAQQCLKKKDILVSTVRPNLKNIALFDLSNDGYVGSSGFCVLRPVKCNPYYLKFVVLTDDFTDKMISLTTGASYPAIRDNDVFEYQMIDSPIDLQNEFGEFVEMIDKSKFVVQQQIKDLKELLDKKMDEYFGG